MSVSRWLTGALIIGCTMLAHQRAALAVDTIWTGLAGDGDYTNAGNWSNGAPTTNYQAYFQASTAAPPASVSIPTNVTTQYLFFGSYAAPDDQPPYTDGPTGTTFTGAGTFTIQSNGNIDSGNASSAVTFSNQELDLTRAAQLYATNTDLNINTSVFKMGVGGSSGVPRMQTSSGSGFAGNINVTPAVDFSSATVNRNLALVAAPNTTITLQNGAVNTSRLGTIVVSSVNGSGVYSPTGTLQGSVVLGPSTWSGNVNIGDEVLKLNSPTSLGVQSSGAYAQVGGGASAVGGIQLLSGANLAASHIYLDQRPTGAPVAQLDNSTGSGATGMDNASQLELERGGQNGAGINNWFVSANGTGATDVMTIAAPVFTTPDEDTNLNGTPILNLGGVGKGVISGNITENVGTNGLNVLNLQKNDGGSWTLSGSNSYTGTTEVAAGTLIVNGTHTGGGLYTVDSGATLGGSGTIDAAVNLSGAIAPGNSPGTMTVGALTLLNGSSANMEMQNTSGLHAPGGGLSDLVDVTGLLQIAAGNPTITINASAVGGGALGTGAGGTWTLASYATSSVLSTPTWVINGIAAGYSAAIDLSTPNQVNLVLTAVPEPSTFVLAGLGAFGLIYFRRRSSNRTR